MRNKFEILLILQQDLEMYIHTYLVNYVYLVHNNNNNHSLKTCHDIYTNYPPVASL